MLVVIEFLNIICLELFLRYSKNIKIIKYSNFKIDRSLNSSKFRNITKYKNQNWNILIKKLKSFMDKNKFKY